MTALWILLALTVAAAVWLLVQARPRELPPPRSEPPPPESTFLDDPDSRAEPRGPGERPRPPDGSHAIVPRVSRPRAPREPVVFVHGLLGFDTVRLVGVRQDYFRGLPSRLRHLGVDARFARLPPVAAVSTRAEHLARYVRSLPADRVHIIAHSLGGIDARYAIAHLGLADRVASLTTVGTPHRGTPLADLGADALRVLRVRLPAMSDLTTARAAEFNAQFGDVAGVHYASVVGAATAVRRVPTPLAPGYLFLRRSSGPNDGLVTADSQRWGEVLAEIDADHWGQVGWSRHFDAVGFYADLVRELFARGL